MWLLQYHRSLLNLRPQGTLGYLQWCLAKLQGEHFGYLAGSFSSYVSACPNLEAHFGPNNREVLYSMNVRSAPASLVADATLSVCQWVLGWAGPSADPNERHCIRGQHSGSSFAVFPTDAPGSRARAAFTPRSHAARLFVQIAAIKASCLRYIVGSSKYRKGARAHIQELVQNPDQLVARTANDALRAMSRVMTPCEVGSSSNFQHLPYFLPGARPWRHRFVDRAHSAGEVRRGFNPVHAKPSCGVGVLEGLELVWAIRSSDAGSSNGAGLFATWFYGTHYFLHLLIYPLTIDTARRRAKARSKKSCSFRPRFLTFRPRALQTWFWN